ncbi:hypothetical protein WJX72_001169 [[Myrmecia] bisecta]|uniref:Uncharacterized protein n=1 Tax=[Myrmecia] bisecta TaxID=41462 RepID=A0AAW1QE73_9CHLO
MLEVNGPLQHQLLQGLFIATTTSAKGPCSRNKHLSCCEEFWHRDKDRVACAFFACSRLASGIRRRHYVSMDCDYVIYDVKAEAPSNKYIVIHAGGCDTYTEVIGDWAYNATGYNLFGLRPCVGIDTQTCTLNRSVCVTIHVSWTMPSQPPQLDPASKLLFLHEFDGLPTYPWAGPCNETTPAYICVYSDDEEDVFDRKFYGALGSSGVKELLEQLANSEYIPCAVEVIDARNSSLTPGLDNGPSWGKAYATNRSPHLPCSGLYPQIVTQGWAWEMQGSITAGMKLTILKQQEGGESVYTGVLASFAQAIDIVLGE